MYQDQENLKKNTKFKNNLKKVQIQSMTNKKVLLRQE